MNDDSFVRVVSFDAMTNKDLPDYSFTLRAKSPGYKRTRHSRVFMIATDLANYSESALNWAIDSMMEDGDELIVLRVVTVEIKNKKKDGLLQAEEKVSREKANDIMKRIIDNSNQWNKKVSVVIEFVIGKVHDTIQRMIPMYQPSLLIVGTRGLSDFKSMLVGSVSRYCLQHSPIPVTVVRSEEQVRKSSFDINSAIALDNVSNRRIVAMGDLHGDLSNTLSILKFSKIIDEDHHWIAGDTILVQTGDVVDRGLDTIKLYKLLQDLRKEAPLHGGLVIPLLGNHEIMNLIGDWRYVYPGEPETFGGIEARKKAFAADGFIGEYLTFLNITTKVGSTVFCHGGIHPYYGQYGLDWINDQTHQSILDYMESNGQEGDKYGIFGDDGPTWYRGYAIEHEDSVCDLLDKALEFMGANRMVVGHTVQHDGRIHTRCGGKVVLIDVGISTVYGGNKGALEIRGNKATALYKDGTETLPSPPPYNPKKAIVHDEL
ncbi:hypothetical protein G6F46_001840 [Rhizopus delemar]|nr:hypothetical protein G6F43_011107 [Rhizopus delemar]KAG1491231.1 hypothetical protein G6F54_010168 [Rhizopus delemar]KAG1515600.1 hypothetical protein G6F53_002790 [Rhizopus delemar]KAG1560259.1 hypothetical protein G6F49_002855 [Rhizopus delemar]KAG1596341.1 hypothetical protein G6F48_000014 [Rhizopus delemar]